MRYLMLPLVAMLLALAPWAQATPDFPVLTGRVVDQAHLLTTPQKAQLTRQLAAEQKASSNQLVVVTLKSLQGNDIATYGYQLGRHWGIGQKKRNNGVLLIVAPKEHKVRIEVGYGLEGALTDALSSVIIRTEIVPAFKQGHYYKGIEAGVTSIIQAIHGQYKAKAQRHKGSSVSHVLSLLIFLVFISFMFSGRGGIFALPFLMMGGMGGGRGGFGGGGFGGGGFGGGGGGFGGGGASGGLVMKHLTDAEKQQISDAISRVEATTDAELVTVLAKRSDHYAFLPFLVAALVALLVPLLLGLFPWGRSIGVLWQWLVFVVLALILRVPAINMRLVPKRLRHYRAASLARCQFLEQNLHATNAGTGILIFVSEAERYVEILADRGISAVIPNSEWQQLIDAFTASVARDEVLEGFLACINGCGEKLQQQLPASRAKNELPNHLVVIDN